MQKHTISVFRTGKGLHVFYRKSMTGSKPQGIDTVVHGLNSLNRYYNHFSRQLSRSGKGLLMAAALFIFCSFNLAAQLINKELTAKLTQYEVKQDYQKQFRKILGDYVRHALAKESNIMSEAYYEKDNSNILWLIERWENKSELDKVIAGKQFKAIETLAKKALKHRSKVFFVHDLEPLSKQQWRKKAKKEDKPFMVMLFVDAKPGKQKTFKELYHIAMPHFRDEPGVVTYQLSEFKNDDTQFVTYEKFRSREAFEYHLKFPPIQPVIDYLHTNIKKQSFESGIHNLIAFAPLPPSSRQAVE